MIKNVVHNADIFYTLQTCVSGFGRVAVTYYLYDQPLEK